MFVLLIEETEKVIQKSIGMNEPEDGLNNSIPDRHDYYLSN
jgi:hypothetical protein